jgi:2-dehydro-3-deoxy-D-arabinonate dehydratase
VKLTLHALSSRSIEGENPLYLPQAKTYDGCCALGPVITLCEGSQPYRAIQMTIDRGGQTVFNGQTSTEAMRRKPKELAGYCFVNSRLTTASFC